MALRAGVLPLIDLGLLYLDSLHQVAEVPIHRLGSSGSRIDRSIMAIAAMFFPGLRKYYAPSLLYVIWSQVFLARGFSASTHLYSMLS
jgi:hypothetical protein